MRRFPLTFALTAAALTAGCTHWSTTATYGEPVEVARRLYGAPQVEETDDSEIEGSVGAAGTAFHGRHHDAGVGWGTLSGSHDSVRRTHCVQQAQVDYVQPVEYQSHVSLRWVDVAGAVALGLAGGATMAIAKASYDSDERFYQMDPSFFAKPSEPGWAYGVGGAAIVGAAAWLVYSFAALPHGSRPVEPPSQHAWTETTYVEATGCGLVPGDRAP